MTQSKLSHLTDEEILSMPIKDLPIDPCAVPFPKAITKLKSELRRRDIDWTPHVWASEEWFSPDGVPGFAFPFTLLDPRLIRLEKKYVGFLEGSTEKEFLKLVRHECAHAIDNAFHLRKLKRRQKVFGISSTPYPSYYLPVAHSKKFVRHLPQGYAQAHPEEDWAETFAVWLGDKRQWRNKYQDWPAIVKLNLVDEIMNELKFKYPQTTNHKTPLHFSQDTRTLKQYFKWRRSSLGLMRKNFYNAKLDSVFSSEGVLETRDFFKKHEQHICRNLKKRTNLNSAIIKVMVKELKQECKSKDFRLKFSMERSKKAVEQIVQQHSLEFIKKKRHRVFM
ncbi:MAG: putative zinc-binding metallopeptidase [Bacteriovoracaceae bacterium]|nr:putative zinc-binding metallopeptidase [Bacteriovoracaceae bacterium]